MPKIRSMDQLDVSEKVVFVRVDFNVPMKDGQIVDATRIDKTIPTIQALIDRKAKVVLISHLGRPEGKVVSSLSLAPISKYVEKKIQWNVVFVSDCIGEKVQKAIQKMSPGDVVMLENLRFYPEEEKNDPVFARKLAAPAAFFINDAFATAHRAHASTEGVTHFVPSAAGYLMLGEIVALQNALEKPVHPVMAIVGGAKVSSKIDVLSHMVGKVDVLVIGGAMANTFLAAKKYPIGQSLSEPELTNTANLILNRALARQCAIVLPVDVVTAADLKEKGQTTVCSIEQVQEDQKIFDIGPKTVEMIKTLINESHTLMWNGPLGVFEFSPFWKGTFELMKHVADRTKSGHLLSVAGGGETVEALERVKCMDKFSYVSTAGGAFLEWLEGKTLPGVKALEI